MSSSNKEHLSEQEVQAGLQGVLKDGLCTQTMLTLTGGAFLVDFALLLGASNLLIGVLAAIPFLAQLVQVPSIYLVEKYRARRVICVLTSGLGRTVLLLTATIPFLFSGVTAITALTLGLLLYALFGAISGCSWNSWMRDLTPQERLGAFFAKRMALMAAFGVALNLAAGFYVEWFEQNFAAQKLYGYTALFLAGAAAGLLGVYFISRIPEPRMPPPEKHETLLHLLRPPFQDKNFRRLIMFQSAWNFAINLAALSSPCTCS